ncbi:putative reverse transcriptase domain-containing protein [Tanacetum coccineum]
MPFGLTNAPALQEVEFLGHVINGDGIHVDPNKIQVVKNWEAPTTPSENKTYVWGEEQEEAFQILKDTLCNAHVLALPNGPEDFVVYCDASGLRLGCVFMQRRKVIAYASRQLKIHEKNYATHDLELEVFRDYDCEIRYHPGKANVVADALSRKEIIKPKRVRGMNMTIQSSIKDKILVAQNEVSKVVNAPVEMLTLIMNEAHNSKYSVHPEADKKYYDLRQPEILEWKWSRIVMDFITKFPRTGCGHDAIWVIIDRLTKYAHFLPIREDFKTDKLARLYLNEIVARHGVPVSVISDRDSRFTSRFFAVNAGGIRN